MRLRNADFGFDNLIRNLQSEIQNGNISNLIV